jgi:uncharacterized damage-inducible protein DinB
MIPILRDYLDSLTALHDDIKQAIATLPTAAFDWVPGPEMNSIAVLIVHTVGAERYWIGEVAGGQPSGRDRPAEFQTEGLNETDLVRHLDGALAVSEGTLAQLMPEDLTALRHSAIHNRDCTAMWALLHALKHTATHLGHIQLTRQMWEERN